MQTKATNSGTAEETAVKTLHVFIYDIASPHAPTIASFSTDANTLINSGNSWTASTPIRTLKADKYIFAGINLTPAIINEPIRPMVSSCSTRHILPSLPAMP